MQRQGTALLRACRWGVSEIPAAPKLCSPKAGSAQAFLHPHTYATQKRTRRKPRGSLGKASNPCSRDQCLVPVNFQSSTRLWGVAVQHPQTTLLKMGRLQVCKAEGPTSCQMIWSGSQFLDGCQAFLAIPGCFLRNERLLLLCVHACVYVDNCLSGPTSCFQSGCRMHRSQLTVAGSVGAVGWETGSRYTIFDSWKGILGSGVGESRISRGGWLMAVNLEQSQKYEGRAGLALCSGARVSSRLSPQRHY